MTVDQTDSGTPIPRMCRVRRAVEVHPGSVSCTAPILSGWEGSVVHHAGVGWGSPVRRPGVLHLAQALAAKAVDLVNDAEVGQVVELGGGVAVLQGHALVALRVRRGERG